MSPRLLLSLIIFFPLLCGCTSYLAQVSYLQAPDRQSTIDVLQNVYVLIHRPPPLNEQSFGRSGAVSEEELPAQLDVTALASRLSRELQRRGGRLGAYRVISGDSADPFLARLHPTSILRVEIDPPALSDTVVQKEFQEKIKDKKVTVKRPEHQVSGNMRVRLQLTRASDGAELRRYDTRLEKFQSFNDDGKDKKAERRQTLAQDLFTQVSDKPLAAVLPVDVVSRQRRLFDISGDSVTARACRDAEQGRWSEAAQIWKNRLAQNPRQWKMAWNLGVYAESQRDLEAARRYYRQSEELAVAHEKRKPSMSWENVYADLQDPLIARPMEADPNAAWFNQRIAVLPFTDMTNSVDGPINVRRLTQQALLSKGYAQTLPLSEVDDRLREHGFTQGGQLKAATPAEIARWLNADLLVYGDLEKFDEFTLGILGWKRMTGSYEVWSRRDQNVFWTNQQKVSRASFASGKKNAWWVSALQQLASSWADKASGAPMSEESAYFVQELLLPFPVRPPSQ